ncbi:hypothetical protein HPP92_022706 [Vanilla planifolia]|uniref:Uncharacterized protein n=1 Tax=Vanilla planifolia TaxID=51239 RepID=A0A835PSJ4_VANPL|nr:hypothetical protein HPP92_023002 [Vanilla planifolia]KAG0459578.1 hypothetical protein HPP92_022706 [Vanilla planifolia]
MENPHGGGLLALQRHCWISLVGPAALIFFRANSDALRSIRSRSGASVASTTQVHPTCGRTELPAVVLRLRGPDKRGLTRFLG